MKQGGDEMIEIGFNMLVASITASLMLFFGFLTWQLLKYFKEKNGK